MLLIAVVVGIGAGLGAVVFRQLINGIHEFSYGDVAGWLSGMGGWHLLVIPALGGAIVGPLVHYYAREAKGHGVPEVMQALELRGGRIRPRVAIVKASPPPCASAREVRWGARGRRCSWPAR